MAVSEEVQVYSTRDHIEDMVSSVFWNDIVTELEGWKVGFEREMRSIVEDAASENPTTVQFLLHLGDLNGRQKAIDYVLALPDVFLQILEDKKNDSGRK